ncbi:NAD(P)-dependent glycerol-3-phosphate dehydrogenase [Marinicella sp. S1101]|uniref:NAD(P)H-dependent glycerol-3-phosphate dehydrogenase n=1 Tax=Marinicella marina TaxID=2996016 RepID=UPI002260B96B|nr:NAD(P)H-dependent glycerol-3-phosphate dehydrogenase [Marinicella marina]MCX7554344.1 NAD(P)-dependent glycerol-3-phosphate dehydrogenase [Marinicella marina]MDJ1138665.1 NAD(P)H-dependent glycerol-3-phosphate dehydrogenase [Marinicella marina]
MKFAVLGAGSWGTALAMQLSRNHETVLWGRNQAGMEAMQQSRTNEQYLPGIVFPEKLIIETDLDAAIAQCEAVLVVCPSHAFGDILRQIKPLLGARPLAWASKGFEPGTGRFLHEVAEEIIGDAVPMALVTGPSFAKDVAMDKPTLVAVASQHEDFAMEVSKALKTNNFRAYISTDVIGAELGGAVKNVLALATGIADGMELGDNTRAALMTRGMAEMMRLGEALGCRPETLMGLSGLGDLVLTSTGDLSRNRRMGLALGRGESIAEAQANIGQVVEGIGTTDEVMRLAQKHGVDMPITEHVWKVVHGQMTTVEALSALMDRKVRPEFS